MPASAARQLTVWAHSATMHDPPQLALAKKLHVLAALEDPWRPNAVPTVPSASSIEPVSHTLSTMRRSAFRPVVLSDSGLLHAEHMQEGPLLAHAEGWAGAEAWHFWLAAQHALRVGAHAQALRCALVTVRYGEVVGNEAAWQLVGTAALAAGALGLVSLAFAHLESLPTLLQVHSLSLDVSLVMVDALYHIRACLLSITHACL